ncbi:transmembrane and ubiquitin-like domain-containing protein 1 [Rhineura floridana]|uniref:transmembrane and ubiquitin-like domain-containing protein 1 n=1 Tax=Rhineura floridana TaxID=261503 RepID=UPI002AC82F95|nr:transmembrane and ubiquitin-like domain-containing protein 1 [Rhineura floridana]XP_061441624.1 transmembrane and ubiquitin-like domain-containing protein 1 [Rhineura floridana]
MALIEGVGDEVTLLFGVLLVLMVLVLAWFSTRTVDRGDPLFAASPPLAAGQLREEGLLEDRSGVQVSGVGQVKDEGAPSSEAASGGPGSGLGDLRHRTGPSSAPGSSLPPAGTSAEFPPADSGIVLRLKFLNDTERLARVHPEDTVGALKRAHFPGQEQLVRLIYQGQLLRDDSQTLSALHLTHNSVLHCHISQYRPPLVPAGAHAHATHADAAHAALNVGSLMVPLFVLMLGALWYFQMQYRHVFTATATTCLAGLTLVFSFVAFAVYRR